LMADEIYFVLTDQIRSSLESYSDASVLDNVKNTELGDVIEYRYISQAFHERKKYDPEKFKYLHEFLEGSHIYEKPIREKPKSPELLKRLEKLKEELEEKKYNEMVKNVSQAKNKSLGSEFGAEVRSTSKQFMSVINFVLTIFGSAVFAYYAAEFAWNDFGKRIIFSVIVGTVVALAELYFLARTEI